MLKIVFKKITPLIIIFYSLFLSNCSIHKLYTLEEYWKTIKSIDIMDELIASEITINQNHRNPEEFFMFRDSIFITFKPEDYPISINDLNLKNLNENEQRYYVALINDYIKLLNSYKIFSIENLNIGYIEFKFNTSIIREIDLYERDCDISFNTNADNNIAELVFIYDEKKFINSMINFNLIQLDKQWYYCIKSNGKKRL